VFPVERHPRANNQDVTVRGDGQVADPTDQRPVAEDLAPRGRTEPAVEPPDLCVVGQVVLVVDIHRQDELPRGEAGDALSDPTPEHLRGVEMSGRMNLVNREGPVAHKQGPD